MWGIISAYRKAFRLWIRSKTRPYSIEEAEEKRYYFANLYALAAWCALGFCAYRMHINDTFPPIRQDLPRNTITIEKSGNTILKFTTTRGFTKVEDVTYSKEEMQKLKNKPVSDSVDPTVKS